jgi:hypothetical protein
MVAEQDAKVYILYTRWGISPETIQYRVADINSLAFGGQTTFISTSSDLNNVSGMKQLLPQGSLIAVAGTSSTAFWNGFGSPPGGGPRPPGPPQNLIATVQSAPVRVEVSWTAPGDAVSGYNIYRQVGGGALVKLNGSPLPGPSFTDSSPPEADLCYQATALGTTGLEGAASNIACVNTRPAPQGVIDTRIAAGADDAEESSNGSVSLNGSDLEMMTDGNSPQRVVGLRFRAVAIPPGASVTRAYVQFQADEAQSEATTLTIRGQAADNAPVFTGGNGSLTARLASGTQAAATWANLAPWTVGQAGPNQRTSELAPVLQEIVGRSGWRSGNAVALLITGSGHRTAESFDGGGPAALLHVEYNTGPVSNRAPIVNAGPDQIITLPSGALLDGTVSDDGLPAPPALVTTWSQIGGTGTATLANDHATDTQATFSAAGTYLLELRANDGEFETRDTISIVVQDIPSGALTFETRIVAADDDVEERLDTTINLTSPDLEMMTDGNPQRAVGMRFTGVTIPPGSNVTRAYVQFQAREAQSEATSLTIRGEAVDNALAFTSANGNVTGRLVPGTQAAATWANLAPWSAGQAGSNQQTPELAPVIREIVGRAGWQSGNALVLVVTGSGHRTATSYDGSASAAPLLHVEFTSGSVISRAQKFGSASDGAAPLFAARVAPNPVSSSATLGFALPVAGPVRIEIFDVQGRRVRVLLDLANMSVGSHQVELDGKDDAGARLRAGVYLYRLRASDRALTGRFLIAR